MARHEINKSSDCHTSRRSARHRNHDAERIYPAMAPQGLQLPHIIIHAVSSNDEQTLAGAGHIFESRIQCDCIAPTATAAIALGEAVRALEQRPVDRDPDLIDNYGDGISFTDASDDATAFRVVLGFFIIHR